jgi:hypothetical protein
VIISDSRRFAFIHIPKCGGTSVRSQLARYDERKGAFEGRIDNHPNLGLVDFVHLPLATLNAFFPDEFECVQSYSSFTVIRDPFDRFQSAVSQFCNYQTDTPIKFRGTDALSDVVKYLIDRLSEEAESRDHGFPFSPAVIHFQPQCDYVFLGGKKVVQTVIPLHQMHILSTQLYPVLGKKIRFEDKNNQSLHYKSVAGRKFLKLANQIIPAPGRIVPQPLRSSFRKLIYTPQLASHRMLYESPLVTDFLNEFYSDDIRFWRHRVEVTE